jgi:3'(2'), 5'-bisphosphate nucleotidase
MNLLRELEVATRLAFDAGAVAMRYFRTDLKVEHKAGDEPVTRADREASEVILAGLRAAFPGDVLISEEAPDDPARLERGRRVWFIDPIDGTRSFIEGNEGFAVMIGLCLDGRPRLGVVYQPVTERMYLAEPGSGARMQTRTEVRTLRVSEVEALTESRLVTSHSHRSPELEQLRAALGSRDELSMSSVGLKLGVIALGERDLYVNPSSRSKAWDSCGPEAILAEAGGRFTDLDGQPLRYDLPELRNMRGLLGSNGRLHGLALGKIAPLLPPKP